MGRTGISYKNNTMTYFPRIAIEYADTPAIDAFNRLRTSSPESVFDSQFTYNLNPLVYEAVTANSGATVTHDASNRMAVMGFSGTTTGGKAFMQTYDAFRYQPGKSQLIYISFNFLSTSTNTLKFAGYSDGSNGIEFQQSGSTLQFTLLSDTSLGDETIEQTNWNLDKLDGTGSSGVTLDITKTNILVIDMQALYAGRVRIGFDIDGIIIYAHEFTHSNTSAYPFIQSANLPIRAGMTCTGTVTTTMNFICSSVISEGGAEEVSARIFTTEGTVTAGSGARTHVLSVRPKTTFNSITNRIKFDLDSINILVTGANPVFWELCIGQAISGTTTFGDVNATYSGFEFNTLGTISGSPTLVIAAGYTQAGGANGGQISRNLISRYPITLDAAGAVRALGTLSLIATGITGTSAMRGSIGWKEIR